MLSLLLLLCFDVAAKDGEAIIEASALGAVHDSILGGFRNLIAITAATSYTFLEAEHRLKNCSTSSGSNMLQPQQRRKQSWRKLR